MRKINTTLRMSMWRKKRRKTRKKKRAPRQKRAQGRKAEDEPMESPE